MRVTVVVPGWWKNPHVRKGSGDHYTYRGGEAGFSHLEKVVNNTDSDIILFPGGFITHYRNRDKYIEKIKNLKFKGLLVTGFDKRNDLCTIEGYNYLSPLVVNHGRAYTFDQASTYSFEKPDMKKAKQKRIFNHKGLSIGVVSCGELYQKDLCLSAFKKPVDILLGCVHYGECFQNVPYRARLNQFSKIASFYTYHTESHRRIKEGKHSAVPMDMVTHHPGMNMTSIRYKVDTSKEYKFEINRKISAFTTFRR